MLRPNLIASRPVRETLFVKLIIVVSPVISLTYTVIAVN